MEAATAQTTAPRPAGESAESPAEGDNSASGTPVKPLREKLYRTRNPKGNLHRLKGHLQRRRCKARERMDNRQKSTQSTLNTLRRMGGLPRFHMEQSTKINTIDTSTHRHIDTQHGVSEAIAALASSPTVTSATGTAEKSREIYASETQDQRNMNAKNNARITRNNAGFCGLSPESGAAYVLIFREFRPGQRRNSEK
jgi:hypothetical protein